MFSRIFIIVTISFSVLAYGVFGSDIVRRYYKNWMEKYKIFPRNISHNQHMWNNFQINDQYIRIHNAKNLSYRLGHNQFSCMSYEEWRVKMRKINRLKYHKLRSISNEILQRRKLQDLPDSVDWTKVPGIVTPVKQEGICGCCYAFGAIGSLETSYNLKYNHNGVNGITIFSEQEVADCDRDGNNNGCLGGIIEDVYTWAMSNGGLCTYQSYPYFSGKTGQTGECQSDTCDKIPLSQPTHYVSVESNSDVALMTALSDRPVTVAIDAIGREFQLYQKGVFTGNCDIVLDHGVLAVGYGLSVNGVPYYKLKNSWGRSWGNNGYIKVQRGGEVGKEGKCGVLMDASYPIF